MSDIEPIPLPRRGGSSPPRRDGTGDAQGDTNSTFGSITVFKRRELEMILGLYGRKVADGEWRDYAIDFERDRAVFSVFRRSSECPLYRIEKQPRLAQRQGAFSVIAASGLILRRGHDLSRVLSVLEKRVGLVKA